MNGELGLIEDGGLGELEGPLALGRDLGEILSVQRLCVRRVIGAGTRGFQVGNVGKVRYLAGRLELGDELIEVVAVGHQERRDRRRYRGDGLKGRETTRNRKRQHSF